MPEQVQGLKPVRAFTSWSPFLGRLDAAIWMALHGAGREPDRARQRPLPTHQRARPGQTSYTVIVSTGSFFVRANLNGWLGLREHLIATPAIATPALNHRHHTNEDRRSIIYFTPLFCP